LAADQHPDHDTIANFRREHLPALGELFSQALRLCQKAGLVKLGNVAIDGTKLLANASTRRSVSHRRLAEQQEYWRKEVERLLAEAEQVDQQEDERYGKGNRADELPEELAKADSRLARIRQAKAELEQEAQQRLQQVEQAAQPRRRGRPRREETEAQSGDNSGRRQKARKQLQRARKQAAEPTRQYNFVDPDSRVMRDGAKKCFVQAYNAQAAVDSHAQVIVACELTQATTDREQLVPMVKAVRESAGAPAAVLADAGYWDTASLSDPALEGIEAFVAPDSKPQAPDALLPRSAPRNAEAMQMRQLLSSESGRARYALRKQVVEPVFGQIKEARGIRRFRMRGLDRARNEWKFICATHDLLKLFRHRTNHNSPPHRNTRTRSRRHAPRQAGLSRQVPQSHFRCRLVLRDRSHARPSER
jgi:DDE family transposase